MRLRSTGLCLGLLSVCAIGCGGDDDPPLEPDAGPPLFEPRPECEGDAVEPLVGTHQQVIDFLEIGSRDDGFDLDMDGEPDNKLSGVGALAREAIEDAFLQYDILIPLEFFDYPTVGGDDCIKFAMYLGAYKLDIDGDGEASVEEEGDCNDHEKGVNRAIPEAAGNGVDDDCDGLADEVDVSDGDGGVTTTPSDNIDDADEDEVTIADGDCDDTNPAVLGPTAAEVCGDGFDNDCDGVADRGTDADGNLECNPFDESLEVIGLDPLSFDDNGDPVIAFTAGSVGSDLALEAGPSLFSVQIPVTDEINLDLRITGATIVGEVIDSPGGMMIDNGRLGGVIDARTADSIRGLEFEDILMPEDSLLDASFANLLAMFLALPRLGGDSPYSECYTPDIDVDRDGHEAFCDSDPTDELKTVDICVDGDGTVVMDQVDGDGVVTTHCTDAMNDDGTYRFRDGISVELNFTTVPALLPAAVD